MRTLLGLMAAALWAGCAAPPCEAETTTCGCYARRAECKLVTDSCWCPSECVDDLKCVCGGGRFLRCEAKP